MKKITTILVILLLAAALRSQAFNRAVIDSLEHEMTVANNINDSLAIAINLFAASSRERQFER
ncbi:MAG: hypothetical protein K2I52_00545, partial [Muribaculaceae bacterium]|nr:hypothetical protein [Muribaculaceae bacterium]